MERLIREPLRLCYLCLLTVSFSAGDVLSQEGTNASRRDSAAQTKVNSHEEPSRMPPKAITTTLPDNWDLVLASPKNGYVPSAAVAIEIAKSMARPIYGNEEVAKEEPFTASLNEAGDEWIIKGTFNGNGEGGVIFARIAKSSGCVLEFTHGE